MTPSVIYADVCPLDGVRGLNIIIAQLRSPHCIRPVRILQTCSNLSRLGLDPAGPSPAKLGPQHFAYVSLRRTQSHSVCPRL